MLDIIGSVRSLLGAADRRPADPSRAGHRLSAAPLLGGDQRRRGPLLAVPAAASGRPPALRGTAHATFALGYLTLLGRRRRCRRQPPRAGRRGAARDRRTYTAQSLIYLAGLLDDLDRVAEALGVRRPCDRARRPSSSRSTCRSAPLSGVGCVLAERADPAAAFYAADALELCRRGRHGRAAGRVLCRPRRWCAGRPAPSTQARGVRRRSRAAAPRQPPDRPCRPGFRQPPALELDAVTSARRWTSAGPGGRGGHRARRGARASAAALHPGPGLPRVRRLPRAPDPCPNSIAGCAGAHVHVPDRAVPGDRGRRPRMPGASAGKTAAHAGPGDAARGRRRDPGPRRPADPAVIAAGTRCASMTFTRTQPVADTALDAARRRRFALALLEGEQLAAAGVS